MAVFCDVCTQPGNDDAGYTTNGWLCPEHRQIEFTPGEKRSLAEAITKAAVDIAQCWDILLQISGRTEQDWELVDTCVADIADYWASNIDDPAAVELLDRELVAEYFSDPENWKSGVRVALIDTSFQSVNHDTLASTTKKH